MKRALVRSVWGNISTGEDIARHSKLVGDIMGQKDNSEQFVVYTFGEKNHEFLKDAGFNSKLVSKSSSLWDMETELYRHKLEAIRHAANDYDEFVFLDWDCIPVCSIPSDLWDTLGKKESFQACLYQYRTKKCLWRQSDWRKVCNGGFIYLRDKSVSWKFIEIWDELFQWIQVKKEDRQKRGKELRFREKCMSFDDEPAISKYVDIVCGGWPGVDYYYDHFEPEVCNLRKKSAFSEEIIAAKNSIFLHLL